MDAHFTRVAEIIEKDGVMIQWVGAGEGDPPFAYTVGLAVVDHPELIIFGLSPDVAQGVLNGMALPVINENVRWSPGLNKEVFGGKVEALLLEVTDSADNLTLANRMFAIPGQGPLPALQIVYPDSNGRWPWDKDSKVASEPLLGRQPLLDLEPDVIEGGRP